MSGLRELEQELVEFQQSSRELEQALEAELALLETENAALAQALAAKDAKIRALALRVSALNAEVARLAAALAAQKKDSDAQIAQLRRGIVSMEISNEHIATQDRVANSKLALATQLNNELLEKVAILENDLEVERARHARDPDSTVIDFAEALGMPKRGMPRLDSRSKFQELYTKTDVLREKVDAMRALSTGAQGNGAQGNGAQGDVGRSQSTLKNIGSEPTPKVISSEPTPKVISGDKPRLRLLDAIKHLFI